jgi:hypothetical protein
MTRTNWIFLPTLFIAFLTLQATAGSTLPLPVTDHLGNWEKLGQRKVNYGLDRDEILVTGREGRFNKLQLRVRNGGINLHRCVVHFRGGGTQELNIRENIPAGGQTRVLDLRGNRRVITKVVFWYDTNNWSGRRGVVELWGRHL